MKKTLYILGFLMFATVVVKPLVALGQEPFSGKEEDVPFSSARIFSKVVEATGANPNADWGESFGADNEEDLAKDLYIIIYEKTQNGPQQEAFKQSASKYGMTEADLVRILHNDYSPLLDKKPGLRQEELQFKIAEIQQEYKQNKEILELKANIKAAVEPTEIFANGDLSDSGFDLINDLDIIEKLLFLKASPIDVGGSYTSPSGGAANTGQAGGTEDAATGPDGTKLPPQQTSQPLTGDEQAGESGETPGGTGTQTGDGSQAGEEGFNPNACFQDDTYGDALSEFEQKAQEDSNYKDGSAFGTLTGDATVTDAGPSQDTTGKATSPLSAAGDFFPQAPEEETPPVEAAAEDEWLQEEPCEDVFCLSVNFVKKPATSSFSNSDNCIACHVEKMNDILKNVINHSLVPTKAPGNLGESAECKKAMGTAFGSVSMNFYAVAMPVKTPLNDDLVYGTNIEDDWKYFCSTVAFFPFDACKEEDTSSPEYTYAPPPSLLDRAAKDALSDSADGATYEDVSRRIASTVTGYELQSATEQQKIEDQKTADETIVFFHPLRVELDQMNQYFVNFSNILQSLHEEVEGVSGPQACTEIKNKKECE